MKTIYHNGIGAESLEDVVWCSASDCREKIRAGQEWWEDEQGNPICYRCACTLYGECSDAAALRQQGVSPGVVRCIAPQDRPRIPARRASQPCGDGIVYAAKGTKRPRHYIPATFGTSYEALLHLWQSDACLCFFPPQTGQTVRVDLGMLWR
jgi:hypothetical protein